MAMKEQLNLEQNKIFHLEDSMVMSGIYNSDTLEKLINTVHKMNNTTMWDKKLFVGKVSNWYQWYLSKDGVWSSYHKFSFVHNHNERKVCLKCMKSLSVSCTYILWGIIELDCKEVNMTLNWNKINLPASVNYCYEINSLLDSL